MKAMSGNGIHILFVSLLMCFSLNVSALPLVSGTIGMGGSFKPINVSGGTALLKDATGIDFDPNQFRVTSSSTGDFVSQIGQVGTIQDLQYVGFTGPIVDFWMVGGFSFDLISVNVVTTGDTSQFLDLIGTGLISVAGYEDTLGNWAFSGNGSTGNFSWSAGTSTATGVTAPVPLALLGIGLVVFWGKRVCTGSMLSNV